MWPIFQKVSEYSSLDLLLGKVPKCKWLPNGGFSWIMRVALLPLIDASAMQHKEFTNPGFLPTLHWGLKLKLKGKSETSRRCYSSFSEWFMGHFKTHHLIRSVFVTCLRTVTQYFSTHKCKPVKFAQLIYPCIMYVLLWFVNHKKCSRNLLDWMLWRFSNAD